MSNIGKQNELKTFVNKKRMGLNGG